MCERRAPGSSRPELKRLSPDSDLREYLEGMRRARAREVRPPDLAHLTLPTGDLRRSPRREVREHALSASRQTIAAALAGEYAPITLAHRLTASEVGGLLRFAIWLDSADAPLVSCTCARSETQEAAQAWARLRCDGEAQTCQAAQGLTAAARRLIAPLPEDLPVPWLVAFLHPDALALESGMVRWVDRIVRGLGWAWVEGLQ